MSRRSWLVALALVACNLVTAFVVHEVDEARRQSDVVATRDACLREARGEARATLGALFDVAEAEYRGLQTIVELPLEARAQETIRERLVCCVMVMQHCVDRGVVVTRERPADGFAELPVTEDWIGPYVAAVAGYPEWARRQDLICGVLAKVSG